MGTRVNKLHITTGCKIVKKYCSRLPGSQLNFSYQNWHQSFLFFGHLTKTKCVLSLPVTKSCSELKRTILKQSSHIYSAMADKLVTLT
jgi:hypothetical protein